MIEGNILLPFLPDNGFYPISSANISCANYSPVCFIPTNSFLNGYLQGIDSKLCALSASISGATLASNVTLDCSLTYPKLPSNPFIPNPTTLCGFLQDQLNFNLAIQNTVSSLANNNLVTDANGGTFNGSTSGTSTSAGANINNSSAVVHGTYTSSGVLTSTATGVQTLSTTTPISVIKGVSYQARVFLNAPSGSYPVGATVATSINGTGTQIKTSQTTLGVSNTDSWIIDPVIYVPDADQNITLTITVTGFTSGTFIYISDLVLEPLTASNATGNYDYNIAQINDLNGLYTAIANNLVVLGGSITTSGASLDITVPISSYVVNGKRVYENSATVLLQASKDNYVYYDTWTDSYVVKSVTISASQPNTDTTQLLIFKATTNGSGVTAHIDERIYTPFVGAQIAANTITGGTSGNLALATVTDANLNLTGVSANTYGDATHVGQFTVTTAGRITSASSVSITFPVISVNTFTGAVSLGLENLNDVVITSAASGDLLQWNGSNWINKSLSTAKIPLFSGTPSANYMTYWTSPTTITGTSSYQIGTVSGNPAIGIGGAPSDIISSTYSINNSAGITMQNTFSTAANSAVAYFHAVNDLGSIARLNMTSGEYTTIGIHVADQGSLSTNGAGGLLIGTDASSVVQVMTNNILAMTIDTSQRVSIGTTTPNTSAALDIQGVLGALLVPRMTTTQKTALTPANGMIVFDTILAKFSFYEGGSWLQPF